MVFGHYSITTKSLKRNELPSILQAQPGVTFQKKVRVAHILWIPLFPFANIWTMEQGGQTYQVNPQVSKVLDQRFGKIGPPWYAFAAPILLVGFMIFSSISSKMQNSKRQALMAEQTEKRVSDNLEKIGMPADQDYYSVKINKKNTVLKVMNSTTDSITFAVPTSDKSQRWSDKGWKVGYFENPNAFVKPVTVAKSDLQNTFSKEGRNPYNFKGIPIAALGGDVVLNTIERIDRNSVEAKFVDEMAQEQVKFAFQTFLDSYANIDSSLLLIDSASTAYFSELLEVVELGGPDLTEKFVKKQQYPLPTYKYALYTKFSYLKTTEGQKEQPKQDKKERLRDFGFYLKLVEQGIWAIDFDKKYLDKIRTGIVNFKNANQATINLNAPSNMLNRGTNINFNVELNKEDGVWKVNIPSTLGYTSRQISIGTQGNRGRAFQNIVTGEIKDLNDGVDVPSDWLFY